MPIPLDWRDLKAVSRFADRRANRLQKSFAVIEDRLTATYKVLPEAEAEALDTIIYHRSQPKEPYND